MLNTDDSWLNPGKRAKDYLDKALEDSGSVEDLVVLSGKVVHHEDDREEKKPSKPFFPKREKRESESVPSDSLDATQAREESPVLEQVSERQNLRVLMFTTDVSILDTGSLTYQKVAGEREVFFELHIVIIAPDSSKEEAPVLRPFDNVWVYQARKDSLWGSMHEAYKLVEAQLVFSGGFRADIVIADDIFVSGVVGAFVAKKHKRPLQLVVHEDFFDPEYVQEVQYPSLYEIARWFVLKHVSSIRTQTSFQKQSIIQAYPEFETTTELLPTYYNLTAWKDLVPAVDLHAKYPQFKFILLNVSGMHPKAHALEALLGSLKMLLRYPTIGLVMVGNGPMRADLERQVIALGLQGKVVFEPMPTEVISYMKTANVCIHLSEDPSEEILILEAAASKVPLIVGNSSLGAELFEDGKSACICDPADIQCIGDGINRYLNENQERASFALNAEEIVFERIEQDYNAYLLAYRDSVERGMILPS
jgi:glycosyltransferase involved in cell wall biosynthesis